MVNQGRGTIFRLKGSKYLLYLPVCVADDSMFPFKGVRSTFVKVSFKMKDDRLLIEKYTPPPEPEG
jgi:hypothetical protein